MSYRAGGPRHSSDASLPPGVRARRIWLFRAVIFAVPVLVLARFFAGGHAGAKLRELLVVGPMLAAALAGQMYVAYRNSLRTRPRARREYLLGSVGFGVLTLVALGGLGYTAQHHVDLLTQALFVATAWCFVYALALFARGAFRGGLRRAFWHYAPWWAVDGPTRDQAAPGAPVAAVSSPEQKPAWPLVAGGVVDHGAGAAFIREQPGRQVSAGHDQRRKAARRYEIICIACGDNPDRDYSDVPAAIQHVRGPYPNVDAARDALREHLKLMANR